MTTWKQSQWSGPLAGAASGTALATIGLTWSPVAMYFVLPFLLLGIRLAAVLGSTVKVDYKTGCAFLAVLMPICFALYGALLAIPRTRSGKLWTAAAIVATNGAAVVLLAI
jgi:hypothetical protein